MRAASHVLAAVLLAGGAVLALPRAAAAAPTMGAGRVDAWVLARTEGGARAPVLVILRDRADLAGADAIVDRLERRRFVFRQLLATARRSQADLRATLDARSIAHRDLWIVNALALDADRALVDELARRDDVARIVGDPTIAPPPEPAPAPPRSLAQWDVGVLGAEAAWAMGATGQGIVVGIQDTGVRWSHEAIRSKYRGYDAATGLATHDYAWHDAIHAGGNGGACGVDALEPCDDLGHGTHVTGTAVGGDPAGDAFGVAPGATWIGCRNMDVGYGTPSAYLECFQFMLAPTAIGADPATGDPDLGADLTSNSWICPPSEGCAPEVLEAAVVAHRAAGVMTVAAAGNSGSSCGTITDPPAIYEATFTVGATDAADAVADFSSRGPTPAGLMKPDVVAPGAGIRSCTSAADDAYDFASGTSMAAPHATGVVALLWSARPSYRGKIDQTEGLLERTALRLSVQQGCGGDDVLGQNATWGFGRLDVARAIAEACAPSETECTDAFDEDCDAVADCADDQCVGDASCANEDHDGDGVSNALDCAPLDGGAWALPGDVTGLRVSLIGRETARLRWDVSYASGTGVGHDVASGTIVALRASGAMGPCLTSNEPRGTFLDARPATSDGAWYLVTSRNSCGRSAEPPAGCP